MRGPSAVESMRGGLPKGSVDEGLRCAGLHQRALGRAVTQGSGPRALLGGTTTGAADASREEPPLAPS